MTCREVVDLLSDFIDEELESELRGLCEQHLRTCRACERYLRGLERALALARSSLEDGFDQASDRLSESFVREILLSSLRGH